MDRLKTDKEEITTTRWTFWIASSGFGCALLSVIYIAMSSWRLEVVHPRPLPSNGPLPIQSISDLHYLPSGGLIALFEGNSNVQIYTWDSSYRQVKPVADSIDFGKLTGNADQINLISPLGRRTPPSQQSSSGQAVTGLPYALSEDGSMVAWCWGDTLFVGPLQNPSKFRMKLDPPTPVVAISFFDRNLVGVIHSEGKFFLERVPIPDPRHPGMPLKGPGRISGQGPFRVLSRFESGDGVLFKLVPGRFNSKRFPVSAAGTFIATSLAGTVATGTNDGMILFNHLWGDSSTSKLVLLPETGSTQTLAFVDEETLVAALDSGGLFLVEGEMRATPLPLAPQGVQLVAVDNPRITMVTSGSIIVAELKKQWFLDDSGRLKVAITFYVLSLIALFRLIVGDRRKLRSLGAPSLFRLIRDRLSLLKRGSSSRAATSALPKEARRKQSDPARAHSDEDGSEPPRPVR
jgi:hypothetical protein